MKGKDAPKYTKCWIKMVWNGSPADIRLGLDVYDKIYAISEGSSRKENVSFDDFMAYLSNSVSGEKVTIEVLDKNNNKYIKKGIAP
jgi:hypothetical protein